jgi:hypothetical protein
MLFWLAAKLGVIDPDQLGAVLSSAKVEEWIAFYGVKAEYEKEALNHARERP